MNNEEYNTKVELRTIVEAANSKGEAIEELIKAGASFKDALAAWSEFGASTKENGFRGKFYAKLKEGDLTREEVKAFCKEFGSKNDAKQWTHYEAIAKLVREVREDLE